MKFVLLVTSLVIVGCSSVSKEVQRQIREDGIRDGQRPEWVDNASKGCSPSREICAVGEAPGVLNAELNARKAIARYFETRVSAVTDVYKSSNTKSDADGILEGKALENVEEQINEISTEVLTGVRIKEKFRTKDSIYALASLDKTKAIGQLKGKIKLLDEKLREYYQANSRQSFWQAYKLYGVRENLNLKLKFLRGGGVAQVVTLSQLNEQRRRFQEKSTTVAVAFMEDSQIKTFKNLITKALLDMDYKVVRTDGADYRVEGTMESEKQFLNVEGFEKYRFSLNIYSKNGQGQKLGALNYSVSKMGRGYEQAYESASKEILIYVKENFNQLNID